MPYRKTQLERAFELARSGDCPDIGAIRQTLTKEGYGTEQLSGPTLIRQLRELCNAAPNGRETADVSGH